MRTKAVMAGLVLSAGYGGLARGDGGKGGSFSCDQPSAGAHACVEMAWSGGSYSEAAGRDACAKKGGTPGAACSRKGAVGGCTVTMKGADVTMTTTNWQYSGTAAELTASCTAMGGQVVKP
jgi:hypothetical protein